MNGGHGLIALTFVLAFLGTEGVAQPSVRAAYEFHSGTYENRDTEFAVKPVHTVDVPDAPWLHVHVGDFNLGRRSRVVFTSLEDGYWQQHDARTLAQWGGWSAFFNGEAVDVELHIAPGDTDVFVAIDEILIGLREGPADGGAISEGRGPCDTDTRYLSTDRRVGRGINNDPNDPKGGCTQWITANGALLTAGHCSGNPHPFVEFDIPASDCDGTVNFGDPDHQYAVDPNSFDCDSGYNCQADGLGADWCIRAVFPNPNTGLMPAYGEDAFARLGRDLDEIDPDTVRITGCGVDDDPNGCDGGFNSDSHRRQTDTGQYNEEDPNCIGTCITYDLYGRNGMSGAPVFDVATNLAIGIHTTSTEGGPCPSKGTSFNHNPLEFAINTFPYPQTVYVDQGHHISLQTGKIFRPWKTLDAGLGDVPAGGLLSVVEGEYTVSSGIIDQAVTITAPVGPVVIRGPE